MFLSVLIYKFWLYLGPDASSSEIEVRETSTISVEEKGEMNF